jgi:branched-chain amino acid transport system permease protein
MIGSYVGLTLVIIAMSQVGVLPLWLVLLVAMLGAGIVGIIVELVAFRPLGRRQLHITPLITTIAVAFVLQEAAVKLFGSEQRSFPVAMFDGFKRYDLQLGAFRITYVQMFIIAASLVLMVSLYFFVEKTKMGRAMRACAENTQTARLLGVNVHWITIWTFGIASALAGAAGVLIGLAYNITPLMGGTLGLKGLTIMLFGGSGNIVGAMVAALILGMIETMSVAYLVPAWKDGFAFGILILILLYKPSGLFGSRLQIEAGR